MPLQDWNLPATWDNAYRLHRADGQPGFVGYVRESSLYPRAMLTAGEIVNALGINNAHRVGVIGAGYGWIANNIALITGCVVAAVDTSQYIEERKLQNADITIINADVTAGSGRASFRQALGISGNSKADFIITENVITCLTDQEVTQLSGFLHDLANAVVHWTTLRDDAKLASGHQDPNYNWKSAAEWKVFLPNDLFIETGGSVLL